MVTLESDLRGLVGLTIFSAVVGDFGLDLSTWPGKSPITLNLHSLSEEQIDDGFTSGFLFAVHYGAPLYSKGMFCSDVQVERPFAGSRKPLWVQCPIDSHTPFGDMRWMGHNLTLIKLSGYVVSPDKRSEIVIGVECPVDTLWITEDWRSNLTRPASETIWRFNDVDGDKFSFRVR